MQKVSGRPNIFITSSKRHSSLSNKFYYRNKTLQADRFSRFVHKWFASRTKRNRGISIFHWYLLSCSWFTTEETSQSI